MEGSQVGDGVGRGQGVVLFPIQEMTTKETMEAARLSLRDNFRQPVPAVVSTSSPVLALPVSSDC